MVTNIPPRRRLAVSSLHERDVLHSLRLVAKRKGTSVSRILGEAAVQYLDRESPPDHVR